MASGSIGSIFVDLLMRTGRFDESLNKSKQSVQSASDSWRRSLGSSQRDFQRFSNNIASSFIPSIGAIGAAVASALSVQKIVQYTDTWTTLQSRLSLVTDTAQEMAQVQERLFEIAQKTGQPLNESIAAYTKLSQSLTQNQRSSTDLIRLTDLLSKTLQISGTNASGAATFFQQFAQAASSDFKAVGQELQTFADQNPRLNAILQDYARRNGKTLRQMAADGELSFKQLADAVFQAAKDIDSEAAQIPTTVGRALQQLDNAFLEFIGRTDLVKDGVSSLAGFISALAENFDVLAKAAVTVAAVIGLRVVAALNLAAVAARATAAAVGLLGGGPVGLVITGLGAAYLALSVASKEVEREQQRLTGAWTAGLRINQQLVESNQRLRGTHEENTKAILAEAQANLKNAQARLEALRAQGPLRIGAGGFDATASARRNAAAEVARLEAQIKELTATPVVARASSPDVPLTDAKGAKKRADELARSYEQLEGYIRGVNKETLDYERNYAKLEELLAAGVINDGEFQTAIQNLTKELNDNKEQFMLWGIDVSDVGKDAANNIKDYFADFLFDPFENGLDGMAKGFIDTMRRMVAEAQAAELTKAIFGKLGGGEGGGFFSSILGSLGNSFGSLFGGQGFFARQAAGVPIGPLPQFADGGYLAPGQFGIAGEAGAELIYGGKSGMTITPNSGKGGNTYIIDASGADAATVTRLEKTMLALAGPGVIEKRVGQAQSRGALQ